jgi:hypothetical protein
VVVQGRRRLLLVEADLGREAEDLGGGPELARLPEVGADSPQYGQTMSDQKSTFMVALLLA